MEANDNKSQDIRGMDLTATPPAVRAKAVAEPNRLPEWGGDPVDALSTGVSDAVSKVTSAAGNFWGGLSSPAKAVLGTGTAVALGWPVLLAYLKNRRNTVNVNSGAGGSTGNGLQNLESSLQSQIAGITSQLPTIAVNGKAATIEEAVRALESGEIGTVTTDENGNIIVDIPTSFWAYMASVGDKFSNRSTYAPIAELAGTLSGDPTDLLLMRAPTTYVTDSGEIVASPFPYLAPMSGGLWGAIKKGVAKVASSPLVKGALKVASIIPGVGTVTGAIKSALPVVGKLVGSKRRSSSQHDNGRPDPVSTVIDAAKALEVGVTPVAVPTSAQSPISRDIARVYSPDGKVGSSVSRSMTEPGGISAAMMGSRLYQDPDIQTKTNEWLDANYYSGPQLGTDAPLIGHPIIPIVVDIGKWVAVSLGAEALIASGKSLFRRVVAKVASKTVSKAGAATATTAVSRTVINKAVAGAFSQAGLQHVLAFMKAKTIILRKGIWEMMKWMAGRGSVRKGFFRTTAAGAAGLVAYYTVAGMLNSAAMRKRIFYLIGRCVPPSMASDATKMMAQLEEIPLERMTTDQKQDLQAYLTVAVLSAQMRQSAGLSTADDKELLSMTEEIAKLMKEADSKGFDAGVKVMSAYIATLPPDVQEIMLNAKSKQDASALLETIGEQGGLDKGVGSTAGASLGSIQSPTGEVNILTNAVGSDALGLAAGVGGLNLVASGSDLAVNQNQNDLGPGGIPTIAGSNEPVLSDDQAAKLGGALSDDQIAQAMKALGETPSDDGLSLPAKLAAIGIPAALIAYLIFHWRKSSDQGDNAIGNAVGNRARAITEFWTNLFPGMAKGRQRIIT